MTKFKRPEYGDGDDSSYHHDIQRQIWYYLRDHKELGLTSGWNVGTTFYVLDDDKRLARIDYNSKEDSIVVNLTDGTVKSFPFDEATIEEVIAPVVDMADGKPVEGKKVEWYTQGNEDGRDARQAKPSEAFPCREAYLSYQKGYRDGCDGIYG